ncbi:DUF550 domain-containing protein [Salmonella enterica]|nr:DUF550 domain-containing protein [Salmonella enterica]
MTTITKERIELFIKSPLENGLTRGEQMELARIALASLEREQIRREHAGWSDMQFLLWDAQRRAGNTPVQSPIDHGYRPECECSGCKATARICAELNNEEAEIFADGYNAAMQSFGNSEQLNSPVTPDGYTLVPVDLTPEMREAFHVANEEYESGHYDVWSPDHQWQAMLAAAPQQ